MFCFISFHSDRACEEEGGKKGTEERAEGWEIIEGDACVKDDRAAQIGGFRH